MPTKETTMPNLLRYLRTLKPIVWGFLVTAAVTSAAFGGTGWNVVVALKLDGQVQQMLRYNPDHQDPPQKVYATENACKAVIDGDERFLADIKEFKETVAQIAVPEGHTLSVEVGCLAVDSEPESF
jgi:hypothetical protein